MCPGERCAREWRAESTSFVLPTKDQSPTLGQVHFFVLIQGRDDPGEVLVDDLFAGPARE
jgi:hypothetical protein